MKVLLADDHPLFMEGLQTLLTIRGVDVVGAARNGLEALEKARELAPDVILMDIAMPQVNGLVATRLIKAELPAIKIVMLTMADSDADLFEAIKSGADGYLLKTEDTDHFFERLQGILRHEAPLSPGLAGRILAEFASLANRIPGPAEHITPAQDPLTPRQIQVLTLAAQGLTYKEVGAKLFLSERTIKYHMGEIIKRLHLKNRRQAVAYARTMPFMST